MTSTGAVTGYRLVLPTQWIRLPLVTGVEDTVREMVAARIDAADVTMPPDQLGPIRRQLERRMLDQVAAARDNGGVDLYFPSGDLDGLLVAASIVVSQVSPASGPTMDDETELLRHELLSSGATPVVIDGTTWARDEKVVPPDPRVEGMDVPTRRVSYTAPHPDDPASWLVVAFSCTGDGDPDSENTLLVVSLFDAIMGTWVWSREDD